MYSPATNMILIDHQTRFTRNVSYSTLSRPTSTLSTIRKQIYSSTSQALPPPLNFSSSINSSSLSSSSYDDYYSFPFSSPSRSRHYRCLNLLIPETSDFFYDNHNRISNTNQSKVLINNDRLNNRLSSKTKYQQKDSKSYDLYSRPSSSYQHLGTLQQQHVKSHHLTNKLIQTPLSTKKVYHHSKQSEMTALNEVDDVLISSNIGQLIASFERMCPGLYKTHFNDSIRILNEIMCLAEEWLNIQQIYTAEELLSNEHLFENYKEKINQSRMISLADETDNQYEIIKCYGKGIQALKNQLHQTTMFCFETNTYVRLHDLTVQITNNYQYENEHLPVKLNYINMYNNKNIYSCTYIPKHEGTYKISVFYQNIPLLKQPYTVLIRCRSLTLTTIKNTQQNEKLNQPEETAPTVHGPGIEATSVLVDLPQWFEVDCSKSNLKGGLIEVIIVDLIHGKPSSYAHASIEPLGNQKFRCDYSISQTGLYNIIVLQGGKPLPFSPIKMTVTEPKTTEMSLSTHQSNTTFNHTLIADDENNNKWKFFAFGPGLRTGYQSYPSTFYVDFSGNTEGYLEFLINNSRVTSVVDYEKQFAEVCYWPETTGDLSLNILYCSKDIEISPIISKIATLSMPIFSDQLPIISVNGPGFTPTDDAVIVNKEVEFKVNLDKQHDNWELNVEIYDQDYNIVPVKIQKQNNLTYICSYTPWKLGRYTISIDYGHIVIPEGNPFRITPLSKQIELSGPAFTEKTLNLNSQTHFCLNLKDITGGRREEQYLKSTTILGKDSESGYSSNDDASLTENASFPDNETYKITIKDDKGRIKPINIKQLNNDNLCVHFMPDSKETYINVSVMW